MTTKEQEIRKQAKVLVDKQGLSKKAAYYRAQRQYDESAEKRGDVGATREAAKIHAKMDKPLSGAEGDVALKPGASEGEQMFNTALAFGGLGDMANLIRGGLGAAKMALPEGMRAAEQAASRIPLPRGAMDMTPGRAALGQGRPALQPGRLALPKGQADVGVAGRVPRSRALPKPEAPKVTPRQRGTNPRAKMRGQQEAAPAKGTNPRAMGTSPRQIKAKAEASAKAAIKAPPKQSEPQGIILRASPKGKAISRAYGSVMDKDVMSPARLRATSRMPKTSGRMKNVTPKKKKSVGV